jgi:hypothetical protein
MAPTIDMMIATTMGTVRMIAGSKRAVPSNPDEGNRHLNMMHATGRGIMSETRDWRFINSVNELTLLLNQSVVFDCQQLGGRKQV